MTDDEEESIEHPFPVPELDDRGHLTPEFEAWARGVLNIDHSLERNQILGQVYRAKVIHAMNPIVSLEDIDDMVRWSRIQGDGTDPPFDLLSIPIPRTDKKLNFIQLGVITFFTFIFFVIIGAPVNSTLFFGISFALIIGTMAFTGALYRFRKSGKCKQCGTEIDKERKTYKKARNGEDKLYSNAGMCDWCLAVHARHDGWFKLRRMRERSIYTSDQKTSWGRWKDPINGEIYRAQDRWSPRSRDLGWLIEQYEGNNRENAKLIKKMKRYRRRYRIG